jgi:hypothetical protein
MFDSTKLANAQRRAVRAIASLPDRFLGLNGRLRFKFSRLVCIKVKKRVSCS